MRNLLNVAAPLALTLSCALATPATAETVTATSPDGSLVLSVTTDNDGHPLYSLTRKGKLLLGSSMLGFITSDGPTMQRGQTIIGSEKGSGKETWEQPWGERRYVTDNHNELLVKFEQVPDWGGRRMNVRFRLFDDGFGFRYEIPEQPAMKVMKIADELTEFNVAQNGTAWWIPGGEWNRYEQVYQKTAIDGVSTAHTPITMKLADGTHLSFHEAALVDYSAMWLKRQTGTSFRATLSPSPNGPKVTRAVPFNTPWRTVRIADNAKGIVENDLELNLNEPNRIGDVSYFKPMKYIGIWWGMIRGDWSWAEGPKHGATTARTKQYIDFAARHGFGGVLVEGWDKGWNGTWFGSGKEFSYTEATPDFDLEAVTKYGAKKGVMLIGHHETGGNIANYEAQLEDAMKLYDKLGVRAVKTGYVADAGGILAPGDAPGTYRMEYHDGQRQVQHHLKVVEIAAKYRIAINAHEPVKDTGLRRTYPNWIDREGARGMEYNAWGQFANGPDHEPTLVYTRMLSGPMDYTPGILSLEGANKVPLASTLAKQLGLYLAIYSPIQMAADFIESLESHPKELAFIKQVPADWSESHLIAGEVGDYAIFARKDRNSEDWYVGGVNDATARDVSLSLDFLDPGKTYTATVWKDGEGATYETEARHRIAYATLKVKKGDVLPAWLAPGGGLAVRLHPGK
ncbi:alpha-glucosidase [Novosphingobium aromaticivorans DSM 12444]|uniref:Alpha-glucosidase n=1 Tax=Novosphingobium aromaticivorans (strain ATCC 700278 / DSM 12444 / CCUG 56034 / CIP 105152 / NBRC 16084 / F199) TaxID=279238 RepID=Q2G741_NOVAD|nr:glycoside hydrolase family 97 protein [Novosphingobium aromaticivorans]ABD26332.1 alpha-glucosidase [Novosphingobium aromaticivorans DSM 12444]SCY54338.1 alpha-glucosidase [Novosphingobium aromaticivorans]